MVVKNKILYKLDQQLFRRSTSGAEELGIDECQFADNVALLATSHAGAKEAIRAYHSTAATIVLDDQSVLSRLKFWWLGMV